jgi:hypothetical protein
MDRCDSISQSFFFYGRMNRTEGGHNVQRLSKHTLISKWKSYVWNGDRTGELDAIGRSESNQDHLTPVKMQIQGRGCTVSEGIERNRSRTVSR